MLFTVKYICECRTHDICRQSQGSEKPLLLVYANNRDKLMCLPISRHVDLLKGVKKVRSAIKVCSYYFRYNVSNDINANVTLKSTHLIRNK